MILLIACFNYNQKFNFCVNEIKCEKVETEVVENDLKKKLKNIIQDINTKTRNRNNYNQIATVSLISKTNTQNKINAIPKSITSSKNNTQNNPNITKFQKSYNNKSKFTTFQSKCSTNSSEPKKKAGNAVKNVKMNKLDFKNFQTKR